MRTGWPRSPRRGSRVFLLFLVGKISSLRRCVGSITRRMTSARGLRNGTKVDQIEEYRQVIPKKQLQGYP